MSGEGRETLSSPLCPHSLLVVTLPANNGVLGDLRVLCGSILRTCLRDGFHKFAKFVGKPAISSQPCSPRTLRTLGASGRTASLDWGRRSATRGKAWWAAAGFASRNPRKRSTPSARQISATGLGLKTICNCKSISQRCWPVFRTTVHSARRSPHAGDCAC